MQTMMDETIARIGEIQTNNYRSGFY